MFDYRQPVSSIYKFSEKEFNSFSLSARDYRLLIYENNNTKNLRDLLEEKHKVGKEIGSEAYMNKSKYRFLKTVNISNSFILDETSVEYCKPEWKIYPKKYNILIAKDGGGDWLWEACIYPYNNEDNFDCLSAWIIAISIVKAHRYYVFWFLKSRHFKNYIDLNTAQGSTIRHSKLVALDYNIPFPTQKNNPNPEKVEKLISLITQNIIDKEEQIQRKNKLIDELIESELRENQKETTFQYSYPRKEEIFAESRLDTWIYEREYKNLELLIKNYKEYFYLKEENIFPWSTPKDYFYSDYKRNWNFYEWLTPKNIDGRKLSYKTYIYTKSRKNISPNSIVVNGIRYVWNWIYVENEKTFSNQNTLIIQHSEDKTEQIYLLCFLTSNYGKKLQMKRRNFGIVPILYTENLCKIPIPNFPEPKQKEIAKEYYNPVEKNTDLTLENYLEKEKKRNEQIGIFQLNMEIFSLREKLEELIDAVVMEREVEIILWY